MIHKFQHASYLPAVGLAKLSEGIARKAGKREMFVPVSVDGMGNANLVKFNGSAHIFAFEKVNGFAVLSEGETEKNQVTASKLSFV
ncbi:MAG: hypothetical protein HC896_03940 [Bacteroidales bacterium]|nr:hypothetical protein [Bacteroidales bacterium]